MCHLHASVCALWHWVHACRLFLNNTNIPALEGLSMSHQDFIYQLNDEEEGDPVRAYSQHGNSGLVGVHQEVAIHTEYTHGSRRIPKLIHAAKRGDQLASNPAPGYRIWHR